MIVCPKWLAWVLVLLLAAIPQIARADAIPGAPTDCPRGQVGVSSHAGAQCVLEPPKDCPIGWQGALGGTCLLTPCEADDQCQNGDVCVEHSVCLEAVQDDLYDYGEDEREEHGEAEPTRVLRSPGLLAGPPLPRKKRPVPIYRYNAVNLCSADVPCVAPNTCQPQKLCVPKGKRAMANRGTNLSAPRVARKTATPLTASVGRATEGTAPPPMKRGCAGCATAEGDAPIAAWGALGLVVTALAARRKRARAA